MATITYPIGILLDDAGAILTAPVVLKTSVTDKTGSTIASDGATVNGSASATPISVDYDAESKGEAWITLAVSQAGRTVTGVNAAPSIYCAKDSSRVLTDLDATISSRQASGNVTVGAYAGGQDPATLVLDTAASGHNTALSVGNKINAAASAGDPWTTAIPGAYGNGTAGKILGTNLDAAVSTRSTLGGTAQTGDSFTRLGLPAGASHAADIAAVNAKTVNLPASPAAVSDVQALLTTVLTEAYAADGAQFTLSQALYQIWSALGDYSISGTTITCKKLDGTTTSMAFTLNDAVNPTSRTRTS